VHSLLERFVRRRDERPADGGPATVPWDGVPWEFAPPERIVAVGDVQGDLCALDAILRGAGLVDRGGAWRGGRQHLVLLGDLVGGHADGRLAVQYAMRLEDEAARAGGAVHALIGNHDLLPARGDVHKWTTRERGLYRRHPLPADTSVRDAFRGDTPLAKWLRGRNALVRIGDTLFAHAGLDEWFAHTRPGDVNATVRRWIGHWQGRADEPPRATRWAVGVPRMERYSPFARGPLWTRGFKPDGDGRPRGGPARRELAQWLRSAGIARLVLGHAPVDGPGIALEHPYYGGLVVLTDTRISDGAHGCLSALELTRHGPAALRFAADLRDPECRRRERRRLAEQTTARPPWWLRLWRALCGRP
jgi:hypothetical protein